MVPLNFAVVVGNPRPGRSGAAAVSWAYESPSCAER